MKLYLYFLNLLSCIVAVNLFDAESARGSWELIDDMVLSPAQMRFLYSPIKAGRNVDINVQIRWENATVPYEYSPDFDDNNKKFIEKILQQEYAKTCITFRPRRDTDKNFVRIVNGMGCASYVGRKGNMQILNLKKAGCMTRRSIAHEFLHVLGLYHQHSAHNRDDYLTIQWENVRPGFEQNFQKQEAGSATDFGQPYDYNSIMHYRGTVFSKNGKPTIIAKKPNVKFGHANSLSPIDIMKVNTMYNCTTK